MSNNPQRLYWDTNVWVEWSRNIRGQKHLLESFLSRAESGQYQIVINPLSIAEFAPLDADAQELFDAYLQRDMFVWISLTVAIAKQAREFVKSQKLQGADAVHLAAALYGRAEYLFTYDKGLLDCDVSAHGIFVCRPQEVERQTRLL